MTKDFDTFNQKRDEYLAGLSNEDRALLDRTLAATRTPTEKLFAADLRILRPYWDTTDAVDRIPDYGQVWQDWSRAKPEQRKEIEQSYDWRLREQAIDIEREQMRASNNAIQAAGERWGYFGELKIGPQAPSAPLPPRPPIMPPDPQPTPTPSQTPIIPVGGFGRRRMIPGTFPTRQQAP